MTDGPFESRARFKSAETKIILSARLGEEALPPYLANWGHLLDASFDALSSGQRAKDRLMRRGRSGSHIAQTTGFKKLDSFYRSCWFGRIESGQ